jgi:hypothetical protein
MKSRGVLDGTKALRGRAESRNGREKREKEKGTTCRAGGKSQSIFSSSRPKISTPQPLAGFGERLRRTGESRITKLEEI